MATQRTYTKEVSDCVREAETLLGTQGRAVYLDRRMQALAARLAVPELRTGFAAGPVLHEFTGRRRGHEITAGLTRLRFTSERKEFPVVRVHAFACMDYTPLSELWVVPAAEYARFYRGLRLELRRSHSTSAPLPIMSSTDWMRLYDNTVGFLRRSRAELARYNVPQKRGVLLLGSPGNGKTMAGRWLSAECHRLGLQWRHVTVDSYEHIRRTGCDTDSIFDLPEPGIVLFDDFELGVRHRDDVGATSEHSVLLGQLDGMECREGVVYVFTTNARLEELDPAFLRRGRIDQIINFPKPAADLRRRFLREAWPAEILAVLDVEQAVADTEGHSFAEMSELKKLLVMGHFDTGVWDWPAAVRGYQENPSLASRHKGRIGFGGRESASVPGISAVSER